MKDKIECRNDAINRVSKIMNEHYIAKTGSPATLLDIIVDIKDTEDVETLVELKSYITSMLDNEIIFRIKASINQAT